MSKPNLARRVAEAAEIALTTRKYVTFIDVVTGLRWLHSRHVDTWRQGRAATLAELAAVDEERLLTAAGLLRDWARAKGLRPVDTPYVAGTRDRRELRFTAGPEQAPFRVHWLSPDLSEARVRRLTEAQSKAPDLVAVAPLEAWTCASCGDTGPYLIMEDDRPHCLTCADLDHLEFLPSGNAALSRRAKQESGLSAVVVRYNRRRKVYQRVGLLVEQAALAAAEERCLADEELRLRRRERDRVRRAEMDVEYQAAMAAEIARLFPGCPGERARRIAEHAGQRGSGRVGRSAAARALDENAITLAVIASIRHLDTDYDSLLMAGVPRMEARDRIRTVIERKLEEFRRPG
ncbi:DUF2293 domain-containing protein [Nonomuraea gerenzanensis]|uniref:DUF2293 domain-containing protein n=1 Tax=Nonomuraea gerenzanensis TaxID=93944 RepID=A0A1M4DWB6_9ACTN|nr:DUF2293 domain-containing protein [Nonomuraea gerenzanensis]UBU13206.1 DUF2293 domain-containing protein [Nonomuraea gerenzanensis]SBO90856.1 hypothetical protein BN4615_P370 [Nonomuraea gerenzanensis]